MAIKWKTSIPEWTNVTASGTEYVLCSADDDMSSIKSISIVNGNSGGSSVKVSVWIDTSGMDPSSPEYSAAPIYLVRKRSLMNQRASVFNSIINNATWSSKGAVLKCHILVPVDWDNGSTTDYWFAGSIILSGQNDSTNTPNMSSF